MCQPRKHADIIKAWADGAEVEFYSKLEKRWVSASHPMWEESTAYRVKHEPTPCEEEGYVAGDRFTFLGEVHFKRGQTVVLAVDDGSSAPLFVPLPGGYCGYDNGPNRTPGAYLSLKDVIKQVA